MLPFQAAELDSKKKKTYDAIPQITAVFFFFLVFVQPSDHVCLSSLSVKTTLFLLSSPYISFAQLNSHVTLIASTHR